MDRARDPQSPGGRAITASEMDQIMERHHKRQMQAMRLASQQTQFTPRWWGAFDESAGAYFGHRNDMRPDAR